MPTITAICPVGNHPFTYEATHTGRPRKYCTPAHREEAWRNKRAAAPLRRCSRCRQYKPQDQFAGRNAAYCHSCAREYKAERAQSICERPGCGEPKVPGRGSRLCAGHRASAEREKQDRWLDAARTYECQMPGCTEPKLHGQGHRYCAIHAYAPDLTKTSAYVMARRRGMPLDVYEAKVAAQGGLCALCGHEPGLRQLSADHDHKCCPGRKSCGKCHRDLLCDRCNPLLGYAQDSIEILEAAIAYLRRWQAEES